MAPTESPVDNPSSGLLGYWGVSLCTPTKRVARNTVDGRPRGLSRPLYFVSLHGSIIASCITTRPCVFLQPLIDTHPVRKRKDVNIPPCVVRFLTRCQRRGSWQREPLSSGTGWRLRCVVLAQCPDASRTRGSGSRPTPSDRSRPDRICLAGAFPPRIAPAGAAH